MRGDPPESFGLGKKVVPREVITPDWKAVPGKQHHYVNKDGQKKYAPPVPDVPQSPSWDLWGKYLADQLESICQSKP